MGKFAGNCENHKRFQGKYNGFLQMFPKQKYKSVSLSLSPSLNLTRSRWNSGSFVMKAWCWRSKPLPPWWGWDLLDSGLSFPDHTGSMCFPVLARTVLRQILEGHNHTVARSFPGRKAVTKENTVADKTPTRYAFRDVLCCVEIVEVPWFYAKGVPFLTCCIPNLKPTKSLRCGGFWLSYFCSFHPQNSKQTPKHVPWFWLLYPMNIHWSCIP